MIDKLEQLLQQLVQRVEGLSAQSEKLRKQIDDLYETYGQPGTDDYPWARIPLIAADVGRSLLEDECRRWKGIAVLGWGLLIVAIAVFGALALLVH